MVDLVEERVDADGSAPAVVGSDVAFTYGQLDETANRIAHALVRDHATYEPTRWA